MSPGQKKVKNAIGIGRGCRRQLPEGRRSLTGGMTTLESPGAAVTKKMAAPKWSSLFFFKQQSLEKIILQQRIAHSKNQLKNCDNFAVRVLFVDPVFYSVRLKGFYKCLDCLVIFTASFYCNNIYVWRIGVFYKEAVF